jgi:hypothetical protein
MQLGKYIGKILSRGWMLVGILVLLFGALAFLPIQSWTPTAHAQVLGGGNIVPDPTVGGNTPTPTSGTGNINNTPSPIQQAPPPGTPTQPPISDDKFCTVTSPSTCISSIVYVFTVGLASSLAYVGSSVFNIGVQMSLQSAAYSQLFLTSGWGAARDIANMLFIFILIYIAVTIIYSAETHGTMKTLAAVVVMALLINFSFFITRVVVDAGNILAVQFYNAIPATPLSQTATGGSIGASTLNTLGLSPGDKKDLTYHFMDVIKVQKLLGQDSFKKFTDQNGFLTNVIVQITVYAMVGWIFAILALAFFAVGFKFIIRIIILWFVIIAAPLAFAMRAFASNDIARKLYNEWQSALLKFSFYPAIFLFILLIMIYIMKEMGKTNGLIPDIFASLLPTTSGGTEAPVALGGALAIVLIRLGFVVIMLLFGLKAADQLVLHGSSQAEKFTGWASGKVMGWAENRRFAGLAYRSSVGRAANNLDKKVGSMRLANDTVTGAWIGNKVRKGILAPLANKGYGGARSYPQVLKDRKELTDQVAKFKRSSQNISLIKKDLADLTDAEKNKLKSLSAQELLKLGSGKERTDNIIKLISNGLLGHRLDSAQKKMDAFQQSSDLGDEDKERLAGSWGTHSSTYTNSSSQTRTADQQPAQGAGGARTPRPADADRPVEPGYTPSTSGRLIVPDPTTVATGSTSRRNDTRGGSGSNNGTRPFQNLPETDVMGRDLGRRSRIAPQQTGGLARSWDNLEKKTAVGPDLLGLEKALNGVAEVAARAEARAAAQPPASRTLPINRTPTPVSTAPTKITFPTNLTWAQPAPVQTPQAEESHPAAPVQTPQAEESHPAAPVQTTSPAAPTPTTSTPKTPAAQNPSWWSTPPKDLAAEQLRALHGIRDAIEKQDKKLEGLVGNSGNTTNPVTINQTVVQVGGKTTKAMTPEAKQLLQSIQKGGAPAFMTQNLRRILQDNGVPNSDISQKPLRELLDELKKKQS